MVTSNKRVWLVVVRLSQVLEKATRARVSARFRARHTDVTAQVASLGSAVSERERSTGVVVELLDESGRALSAADMVCSWSG